MKGNGYSVKGHNSTQKYFSHPWGQLFGKEFAPFGSKFFPLRVATNSVKFQILV